MKIRPLYNRVLVRRLIREEKTQSGLYIPDTVKEQNYEGTVVAVGAGKRLKNGSLQSMEVKEGDHVIFERYAGSEVKIDGVDHLILRDDEIQAIVVR